MGHLSDVKEYFFGLGEAELDEIFSAYGRRYGIAAESYVRQMFVRWKFGSTEMPDLIAKRLFDFLPGRMPIAVKLQLADNTWRDFGTSSTHLFTIGPKADTRQVIQTICNDIDEFITYYNPSQYVKARFEWISAGDSAIQEWLLDHVREKDRKAATDGLRARLPALQAQPRERPGDREAVHTQIRINKHTVELWVDPTLEAEFQHGPPQRVAPARGGFRLLRTVFAATLVLVATLAVGLLFLPGQG
jgi:hypothetical protein